MKQSPTVYIKTHGCKLNQSDSLTLNNEFHDNGYELTNNAHNADVVVLNTCTVTATADSKARQYINTTIKKHPDTLVVITGCYAQSQSQQLTEKYDNCLILGNDEKLNLVSKVNEKLRIKELDKPSFLPSTDKTRAMVKIQEGCNQVCAYCIVPKVRGREKSIPTSTIIENINNYHSQGYQEVVLTGTQLGTYGFEYPTENLHTLLGNILHSTSIPRIRVSSLQAHEINSALLSLWEDSRLQNHFHIPLQSGDDTLLKSMRRRYTLKQFAESIKLVRGTIPEVAITTDWIIGFPGESDSQFDNSVAFIKGIEFSDIHPFTYSIRPGTSAAYLEDQISPVVKKNRMSRAIDVKDSSAKAFKETMIGKQFEVLWESTNQNGDSVGYTSNYIRVNKTEYQAKNLVTKEILKNLGANGIVQC